MQDLADRRRTSHTSQDDLHWRLFASAGHGTMRSGIDAFIALGTTFRNIVGQRGWCGLPASPRLSRNAYDGGCVPILAAWNRRARKQVGDRTPTQRRVG
jgi:hypothetical protein